MKRKIICVVAIITIICTLLSSNIMVADASSAFYSTATTLQIKSKIEKDAKLNGTSQGACASSKHAYIAINAGYTTILKYDISTWKLVKKSSGLMLDHANDMTYNSRTNTIVVCNNSPNFETITFVNPDTLSIVGTKELKHKIYAISYNATYDRYVVGLSGSYDFAILDKDFKLIKKYKGYKSGYLRQGSDCDDNYLYFIQSSGGSNIIVVYNWDGAFVDTIRINNSKEAENIFHNGNNFYTTLHYYGNYVHRIGLSDKTAISFKVKYNANGGKGEMNSTTVTYGKSKKLQKCKFTKEGYTFKGWIIKRDATNQYYGKKSPFSKSEWLKKEDIYEYTLYKNEHKVSKTTKYGDVTATAFWVADRYTVNFDSNGADGYMQSLSVPSSTSVILPQCTFTKNGYVFTGYTAKRSVDNRVFGYKKDHTTPVWLKEQDVDTPYVFKNMETISDMTYDKDVTLSACWGLAYTFSDDKTELITYAGVDKDASIPDDYSNIKKIADRAYFGNNYIESVTIPKTVDTVGEKAFDRCENLSRIYFDNHMPTDVKKNSFDTSKYASCFLKTEHGDMFLGFNYNYIFYNSMLCTYYTYLALN